ncbi:hypothetical protein E2C01_033556 [Portunus trituberculatus]|uniref:Uncharacterized protein n=1 Tax=Portunus trituberculatus TaxID=210409 RepID=A0A5B7EYZ3_PORTR|nr:hypothetical protein [Portunus trituberculatus]
MLNTSMCSMQEDEQLAELYVKCPRLILNLDVQLHSQTFHRPGSPHTHHAMQVYCSFPPPHKPPLNQANALCKPRVQLPTP